MLPIYPSTAAAHRTAEARIRPQAEFAAGIWKLLAAAPFPDASLEAADAAACSAAAVALEPGAGVDSPGRRRRAPQCSQSTSPSPPRTCLSMRPPYSTLRALRYGHLFASMGEP